MSKRRKNSRSAEAAPKRQKVRDVFVPRPFEGLADEAEWIALRELVPAASAPLRLTPELASKYGERSVTLATVLPMAWPAMTKPDGRVFVGLQRHVQSGDISRDLAVALLSALETDENPAVRLGHRRPGHRQHRGQRDGPLAVPGNELGGEPQRWRRGREPLAQRDPLGLVGQALERAGYEDVTQLLALGGRLGGPGVLSTLTHGAPA